MKIITLFNFSVFFLLLQTITACGNYHSDYMSDDLELIREENFSISPGNDLRVQVNSGDVIVSSWDKSEVYIRILGNDNAKEKLEFKFRNSDSFVELIAESKRSFLNWFSGISLRIEIKVPEEFNSDIRTSGGDLKIEGVEGNHELNTSGGDITCNDLKGNVNTSTSGGDVSLSGTNSQIYAHTSGGDIMLDYSGENMGVDLSTSGGDISVKLPPDFNADMVLSTSGGDVSCNLTMNNASKLSEHKIVAELNKGGKEFLAHTSGGDIDVRKK